MSIISYNSITLPYATTTKFDQEVVYDESNTDWTLTKFDIQVAFILNTNYLSVVAPTLVGLTTNPADIVRRIRTSLMTPRKTLSYKVNSVEMIPPATVTGKVDARNGPQPKNFNFTMLTNTTFLCTYHIVAHYWENNTNKETSPFVTNAAGNPVVSNRWSETVEIDKHNFSKRTRQGKFTIRSDNDSGYIADVLRTPMAVVSIPNGFLRESQQYRISPDGLSLEYTIVDKEFFRKPPSPSFEATGSYKETATSTFGRRGGSCTVTLYGDKETPQSDLIEVAVSIVASKIAKRADQLSLMPGGNGVVLQNAEMNVSLYSNNVTFSMTVLYQPPSDDVKMAFGLEKYNNLNFPFAAYNTAVNGSENDPVYVPPYRDRGTASLLLQAAAYWNPSLKNAQLASGTETTDDNPLTTTDAEKVQISGPNKQVGTVGTDPE